MTNNLQNRIKQIFIVALFLLLALPIFSSPSTRDVAQDSQGIEVAGYAWSDFSPYSPGTWGG